MERDLLSTQFKNTPLEIHNISSARPGHLLPHEVRKDKNFINVLTSLAYNVQWLYIYKYLKIYKTNKESCNKRLKLKLKLYIIKVMHHNSIVLRFLLLSIESGCVYCCCAGNWSPSHHNGVARIKRKYRLTSSSNLSDWFWGRLDWMI